MGTPLSHPTVTWHAGPWVWLTWYSPADQTHPCLEKSVCSSSNVTRLIKIHGRLKPPPPRRRWDERGREAPADCRFERCYRRNHLVCIDDHDGGSGVRHRTRVLLWRVATVPRSVVHKLRASGRDGGTRDGGARGHDDLPDS